MIIEIIAIGNELLQGHTVNSNALFLSHRLLQKGYMTTKQIVISDNAIRIKSQLKDSLTVARLVIVCGGLGPTLDDITKKSVCELLDQKLILNKDIYSDLSHRFPGLKSIEEQSKIPERAHPLKNEVGTAPGLVFELATSCLILLPGVPSELKPMFEKQVLPFLEKQIPIQEKIIQQEVGIFLTPEIEIDPILRKMQEDYSEIEMGIYPSLGYVKVRFAYKGKKENQAREIIQKLKNQLSAQFKSYLFEKSLEKDLHELLIQKKRTLILAESCTGGAMATKLAAQPDASKYLLGSIVCYSDEIKKKILHVNEDTLKNNGSVSEDVVLEMLKGLFSISDADFAIAVSGIAGPSGGAKQKPVGTVFIGIAQKNASFDVGVIHLKGDRDRVIEQTVNVCFSAAIRKIKYNESTF